MRTLLDLQYTLKGSATMITAGAVVNNGFEVA
jgi:hypothetical protein